MASSALGCTTVSVYGHTWAQQPPSASTAHHWTQLFARRKMGSLEVIASVTTGEETKCRVSLKNNCLSLGSWMNVEALILQNPDLYFWLLCLLLVLQSQFCGCAMKPCHRSCLWCSTCIPIQATLAWDGRHPTKDKIFWSPVFTWIVPGLPSICVCVWYFYNHLEEERSHCTKHGSSVRCWSHCLSVLSFFIKTMKPSGQAQSSLLSLFIICDCT